MALVILWIEHLAFVLLALAAYQTWSHGTRFPRAARWGTVCFVSVPIGLLLFCTWLALDSPLGSAGPNNTLFFASSLLLANAAGFFWILRRWKRTDRPYSSWKTFALAGAVALILEGTTFWNLSLEAQLAMGQLRLEAGLTAHSILKPQPSPENNATLAFAPILLELKGDGYAMPSKWQEALQKGSPIDTEDEELREYLSLLAKPLAETRIAATLSLEPLSVPLAGTPGFPVLSLFPFPSLVQMLKLDALVRLADGRLALAISDANAIFNIARQHRELPMLISAAMAMFFQSEAESLVAQILASKALTEDHLDSIQTHQVSFIAALPAAFRMEEAYFYSSIALAFERPNEFLASLGREPNSSWHKIILTQVQQVFFWRHDIEVYHLSMSQARQRCQLNLKDRQSKAPLSETGKGALSVAVMPMLDSIIANADRADASALLLRVALAMKRTRLQSGSYPTSTADLGFSGLQDVKMRVEEGRLVLTHSAFESSQPPLALEIE